METKTEEEKQAARLAAIDAASKMIDLLFNDEIFPCVRKKEVDAGNAIACANGLTWGRPLTKKEYNSTCAACRAYWHASATRNDLIEFVRTR